MKQAIVNVFVENFGDKPAVIALSLVTCGLWIGGVVLLFASFGG